MIDYRDYHTAFAGVNLGEAPQSIMSSSTYHRLFSPEALLVHEYMLTIEQEVELFWKRPRLSWAFALFVAKRYVAIICHFLFAVIAFWPLVHSDSSVCNYNNSRQRRF